MSSSNLYRKLMTLEGGKWGKQLHHYVMILGNFKCFLSWSRSPAQFVCSAKLFMILEILEWCKIVCTISLLGTSYLICKISLFCCPRKFGSSLISEVVEKSLALKWKMLYVFEPRRLHLFTGFCTCLTGWMFIMDGYGELSGNIYRDIKSISLVGLLGSSLEVLPEISPRVFSTIPTRILTDDRPVKYSNISPKVLK